MREIIDSIILNNLLVKIGGIVPVENIVKGQTKAERAYEWLAVRCKNKFLHDNEQVLKFIHKTS